MGKGDANTRSPDHKKRSETLGKIVYNHKKPDIKITVNGKEEKKK